MAALRRVHVADDQGTHRSGYLASTGPTLSPAEIVSLYTGRWSIGVTFREMRRHLGFHATRPRKAEPTFADALAEPRRLFWQGAIPATPAETEGVLMKIHPPPPEWLEPLCYAG